MHASVRVRNSRHLGTLNQFSYSHLLGALCRMQDQSSVFTDGRNPDRLRELADHASHLAASGCTESARETLIRAA